MAQEKPVTICAVGNIADVQDYAKGNTTPLLEFAAPIIRQAEVRFCQLKTPISDRGSQLPQAKIPFLANPKSIATLQSADFNVVSFACNHSMTMGKEAFLDTVDLLKTNQMNPLGVGKNIEEARNPVILDVRGTRIGFLAYCSVLPIGYWAEEDRPGCAPMRAFTVYEPIDPSQPGTPARTHTFAHKADLTALLEDVRKLKSEVDVAVLSIHWGPHFIPGAIADYQTEIAYAAIDAGVDLILGHHSHMLKPIEIHKGKAIFYSLGNFAFHYDRPKELTQTRRIQDALKLHPEFTIDPEYPGYQFPAEARQTIVARIMVVDKKIARIAFVPAYINKKSQPEILSLEDERFTRLIQYVSDANAGKGFKTRLTADGGEVVVS